MWDLVVLSSLEHQVVKEASEKHVKALLATEKLFLVHTENHSEILNSNVKKVDFNAVSDNEYEDYLDIKYENGSISSDYFTEYEYDPEKWNIFSHGKLLDFKVAVFIFDDFPLKIHNAKLDQ